MRLFAGRQLIHRHPFHPRLRWPSLWCWTTASTIFCGSLCPHLRMAAMDLWPPSCCSTTECLGFLFQFAVQHLLCPLFVFRFFLPVTDSDKLSKVHETKKRPAKRCRPSQSLTLALSYDSATVAVYDLEACSVTMHPASVVDLRLPSHTMVRAQFLFSSID